ncbi:phosphate transporter [Flagelloscypha sp. PMI_526]|nr:phosphate transporter [Flagelloscypha sp. PMI_526]
MDYRLQRSTAEGWDKRRREKLKKVDDAKFSRFHVKIIIVAGIGFFTDAYDIFAISIASEMIGYIYGAHQGLNRGVSSLTTGQSLSIKVATPVGTLVGQLLFGWLADRVGRKRMYGIELMIMIVATFGQVVTSNGLSVSFIGTFAAWRFFLGVGIGGDYPLSAIIASEFAASKIRGRMMAAVFAAQGWGNLFGSFVSLIIISAYKSKIEQADNIETTLVYVDRMWRLLIGLGCLPACLALYYRLTIPETPRYTMDIARNVAKASNDIDSILNSGSFHDDPDAIVQRVLAPRSSWKDFRAYFGQWKNAKILFGAAYSWFALDIAFYGLGLNSSYILHAIYRYPHSAISSRIPESGEIFSSLLSISIGNIILATGGLLPGYYFAVAFIDTWGRKPIQLMGFAVLTILLIIMGSIWAKFNPLTSDTRSPLRDALIFLYCVTNFFLNFGPNTTTFIIPGEAFPTRYRSTGHGIAAASGKLGAIVAQVAFAQITRGKDDKPDESVGYFILVCAFFMLSGFASTWLIPETKNRTLEDISNEDQDNFIAGNAVPTRVYRNSWDADDVLDNESVRRHGNEGEEQGLELEMRSSRDL